MDPGFIKTGLLISIRDVSELQAVWQPGVDVIDLKNPSAGSLGAPSEATAVEIMRAVLAHSEEARMARMSVALGELSDFSAPHPLAGWLATMAQCGAIQYAKIGLHGMRNVADWIARWHAWAASIPAPIAPVAVAYADWQQAAAPDPWQIAAACPAASPGILIDTYHKDGQDLLAHMALDVLQDWVGQVQRSGRWVALAGSLRLEHAAGLLPLGPAYLAVRGCVCRSGRESTVCEKRVGQLARHLRSLLDTAPYKFHSIQQDS
jgi:uncharacterized protein (UPF0264 family)